jgi:hypothetical protein
MFILLWVFIASIDVPSCSWPQGPSSFCLDTKGTKKSSQPTLASLPHRAFALQINQNHGCNTLPYYRSRCPLLLQSLLMPFPALRASIVLPDFGRSWSADGVVQLMFCAPVANHWSVAYLLTRSLLRSTTLSSLRGKRDGKK